MKKNFLKVAALFVAAMLMVVSCSQEVAPKTEDNKGPVEVTMSTSVASRGLKFENLDSLTDLTYRYYLEWLSKEDLVDEAVVGKTGTDGKVFTESNNISLGYLSQGYWKITVKAFKGDNVVLSGETNQYITSNNKAVTVFLNVAGSDNKTNTLAFDINVNNLANENNGYDLYYSIVGTNYKGKDVNINETIISTKTQVAPAEGVTGVTNVTKYSGTSSALAPGYYRVTVTLKNGDSIIGGITRGFLLVDGDKDVKIKGSVSASDFAESTLSVITPSVTLSNIQAVVSGTSNNLLNNPVPGDDLYKGTVSCGSDNNTTTIEYTLDSSVNLQTTDTEGTVTNIPGVTQVSGPTYTWMVDGVVKTDNDNDDKKLTIDYTPGNRYVTCIVKYTYKYSVGQSTGEFSISNEAYTYLQVNEYVAPASSESGTGSTNS